MSIAGLAWHTMYNKDDSEERSMSGTHDAVEAAIVKSQGPALAAEPWLICGKNLSRVKARWVMQFRGV